MVDSEAKKEAMCADRIGHHHALLERPDASSVMNVRRTLKRRAVELRRCRT